MRYRTEPKRLLLGLLISDLWAEERSLAVALYAKAGDLAQEIGAREVRARSVLHTEDYPYKAGYCGRYSDDWRLDVTRSLSSHEGLPVSGWRRTIALLGVPAVPFFAAFRRTGRWTGGPR